MERFKYLRIEQDKPLQEKCGLVAIYSPYYTNLLHLAIDAGYGVQHRGQLGAGLVLETEKGVKTHRRDGLLDNVFTDSDVRSLNIPSKIALLHCRYGTEGGYESYNLQPCVSVSPKGETISVIHNGQFVAIDGLRKKIPYEMPEDASDTNLFTHFLANVNSNSKDQKVLSALNQVNGAYSLAISIDGTLYIARDRLGIRPYVMGQLGQHWLFASEDRAFQKVGARLIREIKRGEILKIDDDGLTLLCEGLDGAGSFCDFEPPYFAHLLSKFPTYEKQDDGEYPERWLLNSSFREKCGQVIAKDKPVPNASFVVGVPDSGVPLAIGYALQAKIPYRQPIIRDHYDPNGAQRLFQGDREKDLIASKVLNKLSLVQDPKIWNGAIVVIGDDSIVRGNVSKEITHAIKSFGAKEVHWVVGFPPVSFPCHLGVSMRTREELIAARHNGDPQKIAEEIGADSVNYISYKGFIGAGKQSGNVVVPANPKEIFLANDGCGGCITSIYPISKEGKVHPSLSHKVS